MHKQDTLAADHIERRLLQPGRLAQILSSVVDRRKDRAERRTAHIAALRKRAAEADAKLEGRWMQALAWHLQSDWTARGAWQSFAADRGVRLVPGGSSVRRHSLTRR